MEKSAFLFIAGLSLLSACGGGGGGSNSAPVSATPPSNNTPSSGWTAGVFEDADTFANLCANPRSGTDPSTERLYTDRQGEALDEKNWLRSWSNDLYLWYDEITDRDPGEDYSSLIDSSFPTEPNAYFSVLKTEAVTPSGKPKDSYHFVIDSQEWFELSQGGVSVGYGIEFAILSASPPRDVRIAYSQQTSTAAQLGLTRGTKILAIDGEPVVDGDPSVLNAGLRPSQVGEEHTFEILPLNATESRVVTLSPESVSIDSLQNETVISTSSGNVGYMSFHDHIAPAEQALVNAINDFVTTGISDLIIDLRYNGGGYLDIASELGYMVAGTRTQGRTFELLTFNDKYPNVNPVTGRTLTPIPFHNRAQGFSVAENQPLPTVNLDRVFVITGGGTCSASEAFMNGLRGIGFEVIQIGTTTCGKPYGYYPTPNCGSTYFSVQFKGVNDSGFGDYPDGFTPTQGGDVGGVEVIGCAVQDDFNHRLGDPNEARLATALYYRDNGRCPEPISSLSRLSGGPNGALGTGIQGELTQSEAELIKTPLRKMRVMR